MDRVRLSIDGNAGCALLGENLQEGEAEFVDIDYESAIRDSDAEVAACWRAFTALKKRLGLPDLSYYWHPQRPGAAGA